MTPADPAIMQAIEKWAKAFDLKIELVKAVVGTESNFNPCAVRYEPGYRYLFDAARALVRPYRSLESTKNPPAGAGGFLERANGLGVLAGAAENRETGQTQAHQQGAGGFGNQSIGRSGCDGLSSTVSIDARDRCANRLWRRPTCG